MANLRPTRSFHMKPRKADTAPEGTRTVTIDLLRARDPNDIAGLVKDGVDDALLVIVDHVEARVGHEWSQQTVALLEDLVFRRDLCVVIVSEIDVLAFLSEQFAHSEPTIPEDRQIVGCFWRWVQVLAACHTTTLRPSEVERGASLGAVMAAKVSSGAVPDARYWRIWAESTKAEKLAMSQLAGEGLIRTPATSPNG
jgi:hypothetical protein